MTPLVTRIQHATADRGKRALVLVMNEPDRVTVARLSKQLGIDSKTVSCATWVVRYAPELVPAVMSGELTFSAATRVAAARRPARQAPPINVTRLPTEHVRIDSAWVAAEIAAKIGSSIEVLGGMPRPGDVAAILRGHRLPADLNARVSRAAAWLTALDAALKE